MELDKFRCMHCHTRTYLSTSMRIKFAQKPSAAEIIGGEAADSAGAWSDVFLCMDCMKKWYWRTRLSVLIPGAVFGMAGALFYFVLRSLLPETPARWVAAAFFFLIALAVAAWRVRVEQRMRSHVQSELHRKMLHLRIGRRRDGLTLAGIILFLLLTALCIFIPAESLDSCLGVLAVLMGMAGAATLVYLVWSLFEASSIGRSERIFQRAAAHYFFTDFGIYLQ